MALLLLYLILGTVFLGMRMRRRYDEGFHRTLQDLEDCRALFWRDRLRAHEADLAGDADGAVAMREAAARHMRRTQQLLEHAHRAYRDAAGQALGAGFGNDAQVGRMLDSLVRPLTDDEVAVAWGLAAMAPAEGQRRPPPPAEEDPGAAISMYGGGVLGSVVGVAIALVEHGRDFDPAKSDTMLVVVACMVVFGLLAAVFRGAFWVAVAWIVYVAYAVWTTPAHRRRSWAAFRREWRPHW